MDLGNGLGHLTYSTLVHPGDDWEQMWASLDTYVPKVKARIAGNQRFRRVAAPVGEARRRRWPSSAAERDKLKKVPRRQRHVPLHRQRLPLRRLQGHGGEGSRCTSRTGARKNAPATRSTSPTSSPMSRRTTSRPRSRPRRSASSRASPATTWWRATPSMSCASSRISSRSRRSTGRTVQLALEPEPFCFLETTDETVDYFADHLYSGAAAEKLATLAHIADLRGARRAAPASRHRLRHLSPGGGVRGHRPVAAEAHRRRHPDLQAAGGRRPARARGDAGGRRYAQALRQDHLPHADDGKADGKLTASSISTTPSPPIEQDPGPREWRIAHPRPGIPRRSRAVPHHALRHRRRAALPQAASRCRASSKSRPTPGTCCRTA